MPSPHPQVGGGNVAHGALADELHGLAHVARLDADGLVGRVAGNGGHDRVHARPVRHEAALLVDLGRREVCGCLDVRVGHDRIGHGDVAGLAARHGGGLEADHIAGAAHLLAPRQRNRGDRARDHVVDHFSGDALDRRGQGDPAGRVRAEHAEAVDAGHRLVAGAPAQLHVAANIVDRVVHGGPVAHHRAHVEAPAPARRDLDPVEGRVRHRDGHLRADVAVGGDHQRHQVVTPVHRLDGAGGSVHVQTPARAPGHVHDRGIDGVPVGIDNAGRDLSALTGLEGEHPFLHDDARRFLGGEGRRAEREKGEEAEDAGRTDLHLGYSM